MPLTIDNLLLTYLYLFEGPTTQSVQWTERDAD